MFSIHGYTSALFSFRAASPMPSRLMYRAVGLMVVAVVLNRAVSEQRRLELSRLDYGAVEGVYTERSGLTGIRFFSTVASLHVADLGGKILLSASEMVGPFRMVQIGDTAFLQHSQNGYIHEYEIPPSAAERLRSSALSETVFREILAEVEAAEAGAGVRLSVESSILRLLEKPETVLFERAAFSMGDDYAIIGSEYPCALPFYIATLQVKRRQIDFEIEAAGSNLYARGGVIEHAIRSGARGNRDDSCLQSCPPCPEESCLGMCGPDCKCWKFVCGDCCYHLGCYDHDVCCRKKFYRTACLFPVSFRCERHYNCTSDEGWL